MNDRIRDVRLTANDPRYRWLMAVLTVIYTVFTLLNLGTTSFPRTVWRAEIDDPVVIDLGTETDVATIWFNGNIAVGHLTILADDGTWYTYDQQYGEMFSWKQKTAALRTQSLRLQLTAGEVALNEIAFLDGQGNRLSVASVS